MTTNTAAQGNTLPSVGSIATSDDGKIIVTQKKVEKKARESDTFSSHSDKDKEAETTKEKEKEQIRKAKPTSEKIEKIGKNGNVGKIKQAKKIDLEPDR